MKDVLENLRRKAELVRSALEGPGGKELVKILHDEFDMPDLRGDTVEETYYNLGRRDSIIYLEQLCDAAKVDG